jgi:hypothetical protein
MNWIKKWSPVVLMTLIVLSLTGNTTAQNAKFGLKGGLNLSHLSIEDANDKNIIPGFHAGGFASIPVSGAFSIQPELLYSMKGTKWEQQSASFTSEVKLKLSYLELPVNLVYNLARDVDFQVGPYVGFLLGANADSEIKSGSTSINFSNELSKEHFKSTDFGLQGGMRFFLNPLYLGFTYKLGLSEVAKEDGRARPFVGDASNRTIQIFAGIAF